jgi:hypothetical protein
VHGRSCGPPCPAAFLLPGALTRRRLASNERPVGACRRCTRNHFSDIYVTNYGRNTLYRNLGGGAFADVTARAGVGAGGWRSSAVWADLDSDGLLDLYVATYLAYDTRRHGACEAIAPGEAAKVPAYCHPHHFEGVPDVVYRNLGDGRFRDVTRESGIAGCRGWLAGKGLGVVACDFDGDGDADVLVANDSVPNNLWRNLGGCGSRTSRSRRASRSTPRACPRPAWGSTSATRTGMGSSTST